MKFKAYSWFNFQCFWLLQSNNKTYCLLFCHMKWCRCSYVGLFSFLHFRMNESPSTIFEYWSFVFWILVKKLWQELPFSKNMLLLFFSNKLFFKKFIYKSILSMIFLKIIYNIECSIFRKKNSFDETFPLTIVNNPL